MCTFSPLSVTFIWCTRTVLSCSYRFMCPFLIAYEQINGFARNLFCALWYWRALHIYPYQLSSMDTVSNSLPFMPTSEMVVADMRRGS